MAVIMAATTFTIPSVAFGKSDIAKAPATSGGELAPEKVADAEFVESDATVLGYKSIQLTWNAVEGAVGYNIYVACEDDEEGDAGFTLETTIANGYTDQYKFNNLDMNTEYLFLVKAYFNDETRQEESVSFATGETSQGDYIWENADGTDKDQILEDDEITAATPTLEAPDADVYYNTPTSATVTWNRVDGAEGYYIYKKDVGGNKFRRVKTVEAPNSGSWKQTAIEKGETHEYKVKAYRVANEGNLTGEATVEAVNTPVILKRTSAGFSKTNAAKILSKGKTKLGKPYVWGASGPNAFDCSGFVYWTLKNSKVSDVKVTRSSSQKMYYRYKKYNVGRDMDKAQPGDILLFSRSGGTTGIYHAALYYGSGKIIHATTGRYNGIEIDAVSTRQVAAIIRMPGLR